MVSSNMYMQTLVHIYKYTYIFICTDTYLLRGKKTFVYLYLHPIYCFLCVFLLVQYSKSFLFTDSLCVHKAGNQCMYYSI